MKPQWERALAGGRVGVVATVHRKGAKNAKRSAIFINNEHKTNSYEL